LQGRYKFRGFAQRIHRARLRFIRALDVNVLSYPDVAVAKNRLDGFVVHAEVVKVCRDTPAKCVPAVPVGKGIVTLIGVAFGFVLILLLLATVQRESAGAMARFTRLSRFRGFPVPP
jgi:hypothetical protein